MAAHAEKTKIQTQNNNGKESQFETEKPVPIKEGDELSPGTYDNRPGAFSNKNINTIAAGSPKAVNLQTYKQIANNSLRSIQVVQLQKMANDSTKRKPKSEKENQNGLPEPLKAAIESLSGISMDDVIVHRSSEKPEELNAHAYTKGNDIFLAPGQEKHLAHEAWHVVQQKEGRVKPTMQMKGKVNVNDEVGMEKEADIMGYKALQSHNTTTINNAQFQYNSNTNFTPTDFLPQTQVIQRTINGSYKELIEALDRIKGCPKGRSWNSFLNEIWPLLKNSPIEYEIEEITRKFSALAFDQEKIQQWLNSSFLKEHRDLLDKDILSGVDPHGGRKHLDLSKKEQEKRLKKDDKPLGTSMLISPELMLFLKNIKESLTTDLIDAIEPVALSGVDGLREAETQNAMKARLRALNGDVSNDNYKLSFQFGTDSWNQAAGTFNLKVAPTLSSIEAFQVKQFIRTKKKHWKTKEEQESVSESEVLEKQLNMFWGRNQILVPLSILNTEEQIRAAIEIAVHGGVTLF